MGRGRPRRDLEYDYLAASYQLAGLVEARLRQAALVKEIRTLESHVTAFAEAAADPAEKRAFFAQIEPILQEVESLLPLEQESKASLARCEELHGQLRNLGRRLGY